MKKCKTIQGNGTTFDRDSNSLPVLILPAGNDFESLPGSLFETDVLVDDDCNFNKRKYSISGAGLEVSRLRAQ
jgi:hypothetical protein